ncbi:retrovirus-related pol polyprotein from transposon TNT 1-94 [Tanacetum coccineum]
MKLDQFQVNTKFINNLLTEWSKFVTGVKLVKDLHTTNYDQLHAYLEQHELHANEVRTRAKTSGTGRNYLGQQRVVKCFNYQGEGHMSRQCPKPKRKRDATWFRDKVLSVKAQRNGKVLNEEELEFLADPGIAEGPVIPLVITHNAAYQADDLDAYDSDYDEISTAKAVIMANLSYQVTNCNKVNKDNLMANETLSAELEITEKESLTNIFNVSKNESKEKEAKNIDNEIALEKKVKELDNIMHKMGQSAQTVHILTKPQVFYDNNLKQALGFQNPFYLKNAQQIRPMLYDGSVIAKETNVISIADSEETLMLEEESRSKMLLKQSDPMVLEKKVNIKPINYAELNRLSEDFVNVLSQNKNCRMNKLSGYKLHTLMLTNLLLRLSKLRLLRNFLSIKNDLRKLKVNDIVDNATQVLNATTIAQGMLKLDPVILAPKVKNNMEPHEYYLKHTIEQAAILRELIQELLGYVRDTFPDIHKPSNIPKVTNRPLLSSTGVNPYTSASGSKPSGNTKNDRISRTPSSNEKNKVEVHFRKVKSSLNKRNFDSKNVCNEHVKHPVKCAKALFPVCNECLFDASHAMCLIDHVNSMNVRAKSASKKNKKRKEWKPTRNVFNSVGYKWKPTRRTFTLVGNVCPLTMLTATNKVPLKVPIPLEVVAPKHVVTKVHTMRPKVHKSVQNSKPKVAKSMTANRMEPGTSRGSDTSVAPSSSSLIECMLSKLFCGILTPDAPST